MSYTLDRGDAGLGDLGFSLKPPKWVRKMQPAKVLAKALPVVAVVAPLIPGVGPAIAAAALALPGAKTVSKVLQIAKSSKVVKAAMAARSIVGKVQAAPPGDTVMTSKGPVVIPAVPLATPASPTDDTAAVQFLARNEAARSARRVRRNSGASAPAVLPVPPTAAPAPSSFAVPLPVTAAPPAETNAPGLGGAGVLPWVAGGLLLLFLARRR